MHGLFVGDVQTGGQQGMLILQLLGKSTDVFFEVSDLFVCLSEKGVFAGHGCCECGLQLTVGS